MAQKLKLDETRDAELRIQLNFFLVLVIYIYLFIYNLYIRILNVPQIRT